jgi:hypothetical protein
MRHLSMEAALLPIAKGLSSSRSVLGTPAVRGHYLTGS